MLLCEFPLIRHWCFVDHQLLQHNHAQPQPQPQPLLYPHSHRHYGLPYLLTLLFFVFRILAILPYKHAQHFPDQAKFNLFQIVLNTEYYLWLAKWAFRMLFSAYSYRQIRRSQSVSVTDGLGYGYWYGWGGISRFSICFANAISIFITRPKMYAKTVIDYILHHPHQTSIIIQHPHLQTTCRTWSRIFVYVYIRNPSNVGKHIICSWINGKTGLK